MFLLWLIGIAILIALFVRTERQSSRIWQLEQKFRRLDAQTRQSDSQADGRELAAVATAKPEETSPLPVAHQPADIPSAAESAEALPVHSESRSEHETGQADAGKMDGPLSATARAGEEPPGKDFPVEQPDADAAGNLETILGTRWTVWIGGLALALGGIFLVRYTIEMGVFGPGVRVTMAAVFGLALTASGEVVRRTGFRVPIEGVQSAYVPAILTAAGAFILFGTVYAAHGIYGFIGPATAFALLGAIGLVTILASLVHGVALAGLGLLGSYATPVLVASEAPSPWALFGFLAVILVAAGVVARMREWSLMMAAAFVGTGAWWLLYLFTADNPDLTAVVFIAAVALGVLAVVWMKRVPEGDALPVELGVSAIPAMFIALTAVNMAVDLSHVAQNGRHYAAGMIIALVLLAVFRDWAISLFIAALAAVILIYGNAFAGIPVDIALWKQHVTIHGPDAWAGMSSPPSIFWGLSVGLVFLACGFWQARKLVATAPNLSALWLSSAAIVPFLVLMMNWVAFGNLDKDLGHAFAAFCLAGLFAAAAEWLAWNEDPPSTGGLTVSIALSVAAVFLALGLTIGFSSGFTTILIACAAILPAFATRIREYPVLAWLSVGAVALTLLRVVINPTLVGSEFLQTTPVLNWLLPGYGIPALAFALAAWRIVRAPDARPFHVLQAAAVLFTLLAVAMQVRHVMNDGLLNLGAPTLAEQSIYTLIALGAAAILLELDARSPSLVFTNGSIALGVISAAFIGFMHFVVLNPLWTNEPTGTTPFFNLLLLGFLMPAVAMAALAYYARDRRPRWFVTMLAFVASALGFTYATLSLRRLFQGEFIAISRDTTQIETYAYSALWLLLGVALLIAGIRFGSTTMRVASAALVVVSVAKVFVLDMSELEGVLRALSFIGLGIVLIGIGLFYQRMLTKMAS
ncbi:MAG: DUF2339 domain-containing protein [Rhizobiaceae bacterium]